MLFTTSWRSNGADFRNVGQSDCAACDCLRGFDNRAGDRCAVYEITQCASGSQHGPAHRTSLSRRLMRVGPGVCKCDHAESAEVRDCTTVGGLLKPPEKN
jgi:hypothetical protein